MRAFLSFVQVCRAAGRSPALACTMQAGGKRRRTDSHQPGPAKRPRRAGPHAHTKFRELLEPDVLQVRLVHAYLPWRNEQDIVHTTHSWGAQASACAAAAAGVQACLLSHDQ